LTRFDYLINIFYVFIIKIKFTIYFIIYIGDGDWGLGIGDWGLGGWGPPPKPQTPNPTPQTPIKNIFIKKIL